MCRGFDHESPCNARRSARPCSLKSNTAPPPSLLRYGSSENIYLIKFPATIHTAVEDRLNFENVKLRETVSLVAQVLERQWCTVSSCTNRRGGLCYKCQNLLQTGRQKTTWYLLPPPPPPPPNNSFLHVLSSYIPCPACHCNRYSSSSRTPALPRYMAG